MGSFEFKLAVAEDDAELRHVLSSIPMEGQVSLAFAREPSYFAATAVDGQFVQVVAVKDTHSGRLIGMGSRAVGPRFVNQRRMAVGYLSGIRLLPDYRGRGGLLARGYRFLRALHDDGLTPYYLTTIAADNIVALETLAAGRADLPRYYPLGDFITMAISPAAPKRSLAGPQGISTRLATIDDRDLILSFLNAHGPRRQFFPAYDAQDLFRDRGWLHGLSPSDVMLAFRGGELIGAWGAWDQSSFKQTIIHGYGRWLKLARPLYNMIAAVRQRPSLPTPGSVVSARYAAVSVVADDEPDVLRCLMSTMCGELKRRGVRLVLMGLHASDPLLPIARELAGKEYVTRLFLTYWPDQPPNLNELTQRVPYLELGCL